MPDTLTIADAATTKAAYSYFTLDEWKKMATAVYNSNLPEEEKRALLEKFPSAAL